MGHRNPISIGEGNLHESINNFKKNLVGFLAPGDGTVSTLRMFHVHGMHRNGQPCVFLPHTNIICEGETFVLTGELVYREKNTGEIRTIFATEYAVNAFAPTTFVDSLDEVEVDHD